MILFYNTRHFCKNYRNIPGTDLIDDHRILISSNNSMFYDRSETINIPIKIKNQFPIPSIPTNFNKTYDDICEETAIKIIDKSKKQNKKIRVMWSGGIDSTLIVVSFLKLGAYDQLEVLLSYESILENLDFYKNHLLGKVKMLPANRMKFLYTNDSILVGGEYNDQLLGSNLLPIFFKYYTSEDLFSSLNLDKISKTFQPNKNKNRWLDIYLEIIKHSPVDIKTNLDFHWYINFCCKWQGLYYRLASYFDMETDFENYLHFFQSEDFQIWSMLNHQQNFSCWEDYKKISKIIIRNFDKNDNYYNKKIKLESLTFLAQKNSFCNYIDDRGNKLEILSDEHIDKNSNILKY